MDPRLVGMAHALDAAELGRRLRNARLAAGMTQTQVVAGEVSAAYLSRIEDGQRRPEMGLLERMARRTGLSLEALLADPADDRRQELQVALDHAELALVSGDAQSALVGVDEVLAQIGDEGPSDLDRSARLVRARALEASAEFNAAILILEDLTRDPSLDPTWLKAAIALCRCYRETGDVLQAIARGESASAAALDLGLDGTTEAIQLTVTIAAAYDLRGDSERALRLCMRALQAAEEHGSSPVASASAYWNASIIQAGRGSMAAAAEFARKALAIFEQVDDSRALAALRLQTAEYELSSVPPNVAGALSVLDLAERDMTWSSVSDADRADLFVTRAHALLLAGDLAGAGAAVESCLAIVPVTAPHVKAAAWAVAGRISSASGDLEQARARYLDAVRELAGVGADRRVALMWNELANLLADAGDPEAAVDAFRRGAAASSFAPALPVISR